MMTRRAMLRRFGAAASLLLAANPAPAVVASFKAGQPRISRSDDTFLEELGRATFRYFHDFTHPETGLVKDRNHVTREDKREIASIAATGFGLTALCIADGRGWLPRGEGRHRVRTALQFLCERMPHERGFFYHFVHWRTGEREWKCELSTIDTALLLCGVLTCRQHFRDREIRKWATEIYDRMDWVWMLNGGDTLTHGWKPESGFLPSRWAHYCEHLVLYLLAIGARRHPIPAAAWEAWKRPWMEYGGFRYISAPDPLFVHQYSHAWIDFRGQRDRHADYFENSVIATKAHRAFCANLASRFPHYGNDVWGITASDSRNGYVVWGGPPPLGPIDGSIVPCAPAGSLPFLPAECLSCLRTLRERYGQQCWTEYGFADAFNPADGWVGLDVIGINAGITLLMAENLRTGFVWEKFMKNREVVDAMKKVGFHKARG